MTTPTPSRQIADRIRELRECLEITPAEIAGKLGISEKDYLLYEQDTNHFPISMLNTLAETLQTDYTTLLTGEAPRMATYTLVRAGQGPEIERFPGYAFRSLAYNFKNRTMEPMFVYLEPHEEEDKEPALVTHGGQEFNLVLTGTVKVILGAKEFLLHAGDSLYFDPTIPHGQRAVGGPVTFVTVINN